MGDGEEDEIGVGNIQERRTSAGMLSSEISASGKLGM